MDFKRAAVLQGVVTLWMAVVAALLVWFAARSGKSSLWFCAGVMTGGVVSQLGATVLLRALEAGRAAWNRRRRLRGSDDA